MYGGRPLESHHAVYVRTEELAAKLERCVSVPDSWPGQDTYALRQLVGAAVEHTLVPSALCPSLSSNLATDLSAYGMLAIC